MEARTTAVEEQVLANTMLAEYKPTVQTVPISAEEGSGGAGLSGSQRLAVCWHLDFAWVENRTPVCWVRCRCPVGEKLRRSADLGDIALPMNHLPVLISPAGRPPQVDRRRLGVYILYRKDELYHVGYLNPAVRLHTRSTSKSGAQRKGV